MRLLLVTAAFSASLAVAAPNERGIDRANFDTKANPCTDFFEYADGGWIKANPIPAAYSRWSLDDEINERNEAILKAVLEDARAHPGAPGSTTQKIGDFYAAAMDEAAAEKAGTAPLAKELAAIAALKNGSDVAALVVDWQRRGLHALFDLEAQPDLKDSDTDIAYAGQGGLGLPDRDYYLRDDAKSKALRAKYVAHVERMLGLLGDSNAKDEAAAVMALETRLAKASLDRVALREPANAYHIVAIKDADAKTPHFSWSALFRALGRDDLKTFSLAQPDFFAAADREFATTPVGDWQAYLRWHLVD